MFWSNACPICSQYVNFNYFKQDNDSAAKPDEVESQKSGREDNAHDEVGYPLVRLTLYSVKVFVYEHNFQLCLTSLRLLVASVC